jgi:hypothetical protein
MMLYARVPNRPHTYVMGLERQSQNLGWENCISMSRHRKTRNPPLPNPGQYLPDAEDFIHLLTKKH